MFDVEKLPESPQEKLMKMGYPLPQLSKENNHYASYYDLGDGPEKLLVNTDNYSIAMNSFCKLIVETLKLRGVEHAPVQASPETVSVSVNGHPLPEACAITFKDSWSEISGNLRYISGSLKLLHYGTDTLQSILLDRTEDTLVERLPKFDIHLVINKQDGKFITNLLDCTVYEAETKFDANNFSNYIEYFFIATKRVSFKKCE